MDEPRMLAPKRKQHVYLCPMPKRQTFDGIMKYVCMHPGCTSRMKQLRDMRNHQEICLKNLRVAEEWELSAMLSDVVQVKVNGHNKFKCKHCDIAAFTQKGNALRHVKRKHSNTNRCVEQENQPSQPVEARDNVCDTQTAVSLCFFSNIF